MKRTNVVCAVIIVAMVMVWIGSLVCDYHKVMTNDNTTTNQVTELEQETDSFVNDVTEYCNWYYGEMEQ